MNFKHLVSSLGVSLLLIVGLGGCEKPGAGERAGRAVDKTVDEAGKKLAGTADKAEAEAAKAGVAVDDAAVTARIKAAFVAESGLKALEIRVDTVQGAVTLNGAVETPAQRDLAGAMATGIAGVRKVTNNLAVGPGK